MILQEKLQKLAVESNNPCITISMNTHRTHPENEQDEIKLKKYVNEAEDILLERFDKKNISNLLDNLNSIDNEIDINYNLESLHIFLSNDTKEIIRLTNNTGVEGVNLSDSFAIRPLIKASTKSIDYLIMLLSQGGVSLYKANNDVINNEITNDDFPFDESGYYAPNEKKKSDAQYMDNLVREYFNKVDKALVDVYNKTHLKCVVICTEDNYSRLQQVADRPEIYIGYSPINYNNTDKSSIVKKAYELIKNKQIEKERKAIETAKMMISQGRLLTDIKEIYSAAVDGLGELLIVNQNFNQPIKILDERTIDICKEDTKEKEIVEGTSVIAWEVLSKKGEIVFTNEEELKELGDIVLVTRY